MKEKYSSENLKKIAEKIPSGIKMRNYKHRLGIPLEPEIFGEELPKPFSLEEIHRLSKVYEEFKKNNPEEYKLIEEEIKQIEKRTDVLLGRN